jgi:hypothetical protein
MALLFVDGFDHYATADITKKWTTNSGATISSSSGRRGGGALNINYSGYYVAKGVANSATLIVGFHLNPPAYSTSSFEFLRFSDGSTAQVVIYRLTSGAFQVYNGSFTILGNSASGVLADSVAHYVEVKVKFHGSAGTVDILIDGVSVLSLTGKNTISSANAYANLVTLFGGSVFTNYYYDDLYICDALGSTNNNFLGDVRVDTLFPTSDGNYSAFTPSTGSLHYALVDEATPNTSDYNEGAAVNDRDSYGMGNLATLASQTVYGVQVNAAILKDDAGSKSAATFVRSSGTNGDGASAAISTSQVYVSQVFETDPNGSIAWTESSVNAMEAGVKVTA